jgi:hypothetical protein
VEEAHPENLLGPGSEGAAEHLRGRARRRRTGVRIGAEVEEQGHHQVLALEDRAGQRCLATVVDPVDVGAALGQTCNDTRAPC